MFSASIFASDTYQVDSRHTFPSFEIDHLGFSKQRGRFNKTKGIIVLDNKQKKGQIQIEIDADSISTGLEELETHLKSKDFLDVQTYPKITFISNQLTFNQEKLTGGEGQLTLHGITKPVHLNIDHFYCGFNPISFKNVCGANATTTINRSDFGVDKYVPMISDSVNIVLQIEAVKN